MELWDGRDNSPSWRGVWQAHMSRGTLHLVLLSVEGVCSVDGTVWEEVPRSCTRHGHFV